MYYVWDSMLAREGALVRVNLHLNRASRWLDVDSHLPYEGKVVLKIKEAAQVAVRIPEWTNPKMVDCKVNDQQSRFDWAGSYVEVQGLKRGDIVTVEFPMRERTLFRQIGGVPYRLTIKGNTVVDISPKGTIYPLYQRDHYKQNKAPLKQVARFVSRENPQW
jgi:hypothetical protein